ncbi:hypothetical protein ACFYTC_48455 [Actinomadura nitritigenes]|jgi:hypothetical protein|uniref:hypothetical protein n=1 Tax=Actinomadura nitritigenes TaxID=134602 RepID=UPI0036A3E9B6
MTLAMIALVAALAALLLYLAPVETLAAGVGFGALFRPGVTEAAGHLAAALVIATAAVVAWRELRDSGWRLLVIRQQF